MTVTQNQPLASSTHPQYGKLVTASGYNVTRQIWKGGVILGMLAMCFIIIFAMFSSGASLSDFSTSSYLILAALLLIPILIMLAAIYSLITAFSKSLFVYESGIVRVYRSESQGWAWNEFNEITKMTVDPGPGNPRMPPMSFLDLSLGKDGVKLLSINQDYENPAWIIDFVIPRVNPLILDHLLRKFDRGETLKFGNAQINFQGVTQGSTSFSWDQVSGWTIGNQEIPGWEWLEFTSNQSSSTLKIDFNSRPNAILLPDLMQQRIDRIIKRQIPS